MDFNPPQQYGAPLQTEQPEPPKMGRRAKKGKEKDSAPNKKVVDRSLRFALLFALVLGLVAVVVYSGSQDKGTWVVRAKDNVAAATVIDFDTHLEAVQLPDVAIEKGALQGTTEAAARQLAESDIVGKRTQYPLSPGEQVHPDQFNVELSLEKPLGKDERLMSVQAGVAAAVAGQIKPGDRVDIAASAGSVAGLVIEDVEVVAVTVSETQYQSVADQQTGENKNAPADELLPGAPVPGIYTVRVPATEAMDLMAADAGGDLTLLYRTKGAAPLSKEPLTAAHVICDDAVANQLQECQGR